MSSYVETWEWRLKNRIQRLAKFSKAGFINNPAFIREVGMVLEATIALYGGGVLEGVGRSMQENYKLSEGFCPWCPGSQPNRINPNERMCNDCKTIHDLENDDQADPPQS